MRKLSVHAVLAVLCFGLLACGDATVPVAPTDPVATPTPAPQQKVVSLAVAFRFEGRLVDFVHRDDFFSIEAGPRCLLAELPCPRPSRVHWNATGAFCEKIGDITGPTLTVTCAAAGVTTFEAVDLDSGAQGRGQIQVRF